MSMKSLTPDRTADMIIYACEAIIKNKLYLTEVDSKIGDGDHGIGMAGGMEKAKAELMAARPFQNINDVFKLTGMAMLNSMGGASGVIFGSMFFGGVKGMEVMRELDCLTLAKIMRIGLESVKLRGKAQLGDKTMVDALEPAVTALEGGSKEDIVLLLACAKEAAALGLENTKGYTAKFGRAKSLHERAVGHQDAGATSVSIIFNAMHEYLVLSERGH